ncbi:hypothetical protein ACFQ0T_04825 [Kitasatospora gansuensis]
MSAARTALHLLGPHQLPSARLLFTVRIADCHVCAHDPGTALSLLGPALEHTAPGLPALVGHELRGLRDRLAAHPGRRPELTDTARRLTELAP